MSLLQKKYKDTRPFGDINESRTLRTEKQKELRKNRRNKIVEENRKELTSSTSQSLEVEAPDPVEIRTKRLLQWKAEREKRKRMEQMKKRPPFVVGVVHHKIYSSVTKDEDIPKVKKAPSPPKRVTRTTLRRLMLKAQQTKKASKHQSKKKEEHSFAPANYELKVPAGLNQELQSSRLTRASTSSSATKFISEENASATIDKKDDTYSSEESSNETFTLNVSSDEDTNDVNEAIISDKDSNEKEKEKNDESLNNSIIEPNKQFNNSIKEGDTILDNNAKSAPSSSNNNTPTPANSNSFSEPIFYSPYVVSSRGKSNARKEQQLKRGFSLGSMRNDDIPTKDNVMKNLNISVEEEERTAHYFQFLLNKEIDRLNELCIKWEQVKTESNVTEDAQYQINQAVGQTNLLISKKFERFRGLVSDCETGKGQMLVTCRDLQGFWDMMYMEVKNCDSRFERLEQLRSRNWVEEQPPTVFKPSIAKKSIMRKKTVLAKSSSVTAFLPNRKKGKQETRIEDVVEEPAIINNKGSVDEHELNKNSPSVKCRPRRSVSVHLNDKKFAPIKSDITSLSQKVELSETKRLSNSLAVIKISNLGKIPEVCSPESYFNSTQTPGKSILKQRKDSNDIESHTKVTHKVNFDDSIVLNEVPIDEETQTKMSLAAALARIDSISFDYPEDNILLHAERKLNFNDSFEDTEDEFNVKDSTCKIHVEVEPPTPLQGMQLSNNSNTLPRRKLRRQNAFNENDEPFDKSEPLDITIPLPSKESGDVENFDKQTLKKQISINIGEETDKSDEIVRVLRNRSIISVNTPTPRRRSSRKLSMNVTKSEHKENRTSKEKFSES